jgi:hypothetical protein
LRSANFCERNQLTDDPEICCIFGRPSAAEEDMFAKHKSLLMVHSIVAVTSEDQRQQEIDNLEIDQVKI